ncbi:MAG: hypothetical protein GY773_15725 [Actinomycetia bacterium]|nr:hypothetical protein [Actinomycetes bacterium]
MTGRLARGSAVAAMVGLLVCLFTTSVWPASALGQEDSTQELAEQYAPVIKVRAQQEDCDRGGEQYTPTSAEIVLDNPQVLLRQVGTGNPTTKIGPAASDLFGLGEGFYLDFPGNALAPGCLYEKDFRRYSAELPAVVYAHVATQDDAPGQLALQYWFFWYFNDWNNKHEGDWEGIQLLFDVGTVEEALAVEPVSVGYSQHFGGEEAAWNDTKLERRSTHPVVYPAVGSHPSHFSSALYLGRSGDEGFGCDSTLGPSRALEPEIIVLPDEVDDASDPLAWLEFEGRWGERHAGAFNGPTGPKQIDRWSAPIDWHEDLRTSSVIVPGGSGAGAQVIETFCGVVELGSTQLILLMQRPVTMLIVVVGLTTLVMAALRRTDWTAVNSSPIVRRRRSGQILRSAARLYRAAPARYAELGLIYLPVSLAIGGLVTAAQQVPVVGALVESDRDLGVVGLFLALSVGSLGHTIGFVIVTAAVSEVMAARDQTTTLRGFEAYRRAFTRWRDLLSGFLRAAVVVGVLYASVVGIPWGIRQGIRYQFLSQATMLDGLGSKDALDRSSQLVRGRWWHTLGSIILLNLIVAVAAAIVGLVFLVALAGVPLWLFSVLVTAVLVLVVPYPAIAMVLLYGDARAEQEGAERAELIDPQTGFTDGSEGVALTT